MWARGKNQNHTFQSQKQSLNYHFPASHLLRANRRAVGEDLNALRTLISFISLIGLTHTCHHGPGAPLQPRFGTPVPEHTARTSPPVVLGCPRT